MTSNHSQNPSNKQLLCVLMTEENIVTMVRGQKGSSGTRQLSLCRRLKRSQTSRLIFVLLLVVAWLILFRLWHKRTYSRTLVGAQNGNLTLVILPKELAEEKGSYCLDGSPPSYYTRKAKGVTTQRSWLVVLQGGGWCWNASDCYNRSFGALGSSYLLPAQIQFNGIMSDNYTANPEFYDWNMVMINYCDGASFSGNLDLPVRYNNTDIYYRGARVLNLVMAYLLKSTGLWKAERIILGGVSAGGLAVFLHVDNIRSLIPEGISFHGVVDGGFFLDEKNISNFLHYRQHMKDIFKMQNAEGSLNKDCLSAKSVDSWKCFFAEYTYPYIKTPLFIINSAYDYWQQWFILDLRCHPLQCPDKLKFLTRHHTIFIHEIDRVYRHDKDGMLISSCFAHSQAFYDQAWMGFKVGGKTIRQAFGDWYFGRTTPKESRYVDCYTDYDCNPSCSDSWTLANYKNRTDHMKNTTPDF